MDINFQFGKSPDGKEFIGLQVKADPMFRFQSPPLDTRELLRQIKRRQPNAFLDVHYEIVQAQNGAITDVG